MLIKLGRYIGFAIAGITLVGILLFIFFIDPFINTYLKDKIENSFEVNYPEYNVKLGYLHYSILQNRIEIDSTSLTAKDTSFTCGTELLSIEGIDWFTILLQREPVIEAFTGVTVGAGNVAINFKSNSNNILIKNLFVSIPDSLLLADDINSNPKIEGEKFFEQSIFSQTRLQLKIPKIEIEGLDCISLIEKNNYKAEKITVYNSKADILVNKDKPLNQNLPQPLMPHELLLSINKRIEIDTLQFINGELNYSERLEKSAAPGLLNFSNVGIKISSITNQKEYPDTTVLHAESLFMNKSKMTLDMAVPLTNNGLSLTYSGTLSEFNISELNSFIVPCEYRRIKSGILKSASYNIIVHSGKARGGLSAEYTHLSIAFIDEDTGSEGGIIENISSFIGKMFIIRENNIPDEKGALKIGQIDYTRKPDDTFIQFIWFALRSGVGNVVGS